MKNSVLLGTMIWGMMCAAAICHAQVESAPVDSLIFLQKESFVIWYSQSDHNPALVAWRLCLDDLGKCHRPKSQTFKTDFDCPRPRAKSADFVRSGYQRGHLCPSADRSKSTSAMVATFVISNVAPMTPRLNMIAWAQAEEYSRIMARRGHQCFMVAGAFFSGPRKVLSGSSPINVPDSFFRACIVSDCPSLSVWWLFANDSIVRCESVCRVPRSQFVASLRCQVRSLFDKIVPKI